MERNEFETESRTSYKRSQMKPKKRRSVLRTSLLVFFALILCATGAGAYGLHKLSPSNHFNHLTAIGNPDGNYKQKSGVFNILLIGSDARKGDSVGHTDSMILVHADLNNHKYNVMSIPRDTRVYVPGEGYTKLTSVQYISQIKHGPKQGIIDTVKAVSNLTGVPINYYAETNYQGLQNMVDAIGGIEMNVPFNVTFTHPWYKEDKNMTITAGTHQLNGKMATEIVHERDSVPGTDFGRQKMQAQALIAIAKKVMEPANITKLPALADSMSKFLVATNMTTEDMVSIGLGVKNDFHPDKQIHYFQAKGTGQVMYDDVLKANNDEFILDPHQLNDIVQKYFKS
ncbi:LCP family protein required for cell wall assembly [Scopulibacillus daqui]|uniref:LCP family protein required for cell wall assembly n=1 Tax=Scopulibacillus daqui TaxID=1469162 RepID=A0ABS2PWP5_9BACL|nr:LCP family protein [Scopulibacillus daqui]MBM7643980.1 LCP family protein required for cell wall assembly [Scopulibacillus daqui]